MRIDCNKETVGATISFDGVPTISYSGPVTLRAVENSYAARFGAGIVIIAEDFKKLIILSGNEIYVNDVLQVDPTPASFITTLRSEVFLDANSGNGTGSGTAASIAAKADDAAAFAALSNGKGAFYEVAGEVSYYAKSSDGTEKKLTLSNY